MKRDFNKKLRFNLAMAIILSVFFVAGVVMIPVGFANGLTVVGIIGIVCCVLGFYGAPITWSTYGSLHSLSAVYDSITKGGITDIKTLSDTLAINPEEAQKKVETLKKGMYLFGYVITMFPTEVKKENEPKSKTVKCANCGATVKIVDGVGECPYCGTPIAK